VKSPKIGLVLASTPGYSETFFRSKIAGLQAAGYQVILFSGSKAAEFNLCRVIYAPKAGKNMLLSFFLIGLRLSILILLKPARAFRFVNLELNSGRSIRHAIENLYLSSHILLHNLDWLHFGFATMALRKENTAKAMNTKMAVSLRGYDIAIYPLKFPGCYNLLWQRIDKLHTISNDLYSLALQNGLQPSTPVQKITPAIDITLFKRSDPSGRQYNNPVRLLTVARLHWKKGLEYTLEALAILRAKGINFQYSIIGEGEDYERLVFASYQLGIEDRVHFMGKVAHDAVRLEMEKADIYIQYSISEGFCNAVLEAQALGKICIVSDAEGLAENVLNGKTGFVLPKRNPQLLSETIETAMSLPAEKQYAMSISAEHRIKAEFNLEHQRKQFLDFYNT
jgi:colanic acid/amylovoran biosynthesis glycosyltransferase